jgi:hypothetical protein
MARSVVASRQKSFQESPQVRTINPANGMSTTTLRKKSVMPMVRLKPGSALNFFPAMQLFKRLSGTVGKN